MSALNKLTVLVIRNHVWIFAPLIILQFIVGQFTEQVASVISLPERSVVEYHKLHGQSLAIFGLVVAGFATYLQIAKIPRPSIKNFSLSLLVHNHGFILLLLLIGQYATTVWNSWISEKLGLDKGLIFQFHGIFAFTLLVMAIIMVITKLLLRSSPKAKSK